jgi:uncharacterized membrane protein
MKLFRGVGLIFLSTCMAWILPKPARADLFVCNNSNDKAYVAVAWYESKLWRSWGWKQVYAGRCEKVFTGNIRLTAPYVYIADDNWSPWNIETSSTYNQFCIRQTTFEIENADGRCSPEGMFPVEFQRVNSNAYDFRINLN